MQAVLLLALFLSAAPDRDALLAEGKAAYNRKDYSGASAAFLKAAQSDPSDGRAHLFLARARAQTGDNARALEAYDVFLSLSPKKADADAAAKERGFVLKKLGGRPPAASGFAPALSALGRTLEAGADVRAAYDSLLAAGAIGPDLTSARVQVRWWFGARAREGLNPYAALETTMSGPEAWSAVAAAAGNALACSPDLPAPERKPYEALVALAEGQQLRAAEAGDNDKALLRLSEAVALDPALTDASVALASAQMERGMSREALSMLDAALSRAPADARLQALRVRALLAAGRAEEALANISAMLQAK